MLVSTLLTTAAVLSSGVPAVLAHPSMGKALEEIKARQATTDDGDSDELIGDLRTLPDSQLTSLSKDIKQLLLNTGGDAQGWGTYSNVPALGTAACAKDTCCVWKYIADQMANTFRGSSGRCNRWARMGIRMGFHDAAGWNKQTAAADQPGGADGSLLLAGELTRPENKGLEDMGTQMQQWYNYWHTQKGYSQVTMADLIQMSATVATVVCPLGPRIRSFVGRKDSTSPNPALLPDAASPADDLIQLFEDKTIKSNGLVALLGAHTTSQQWDFNPARAGDPQDSTPGVWDVLYYGQALGTVAMPKRVYMLPSDLLLAKHPKTTDEWWEFAVNQTYWDEQYAREYVRLSLLGVNNINTLTECTKVLPQPTKLWSAPDQSNMNTWLNSNSHSSQLKQVATTLESGDNLLGSTIANILGNLNKGFLGGLFNWH